MKFAYAWTCAFPTRQSRENDTSHRRSMTFCAISMALLVFSKLDLNNGYHQLELHEESRYITTFSTHCGLRRYKSLKFGINSAADIFQNAIRNCIQDIPGSINVSDDILIFGRNQETHDASLSAVLERLK